MPEGLKLVVSADTKQAEKSLDKFVTTAGKTGEKAASNLTTGLNKAVPASSKVAAAISDNIKKPIKAVSELGDSIETLRAKMLAKQSFLITETDITKVKVLNAEIRQLQEISRVQSVGTGAVPAGLENVAKGAGSAFGVLRKAAFILPGIGVAGLLGGLSDLVIGLFKSSDAFSSTELAAAQFDAEMARAKQGIDEFVSSLDFGADLDKLKAKLLLGPGEGADILGFKIDKQKNDQIIAEATSEIDGITDRIGQLRANARLILSKSGADLLEAFPIDTDLPEGLIDKLSQSDQQILKEVKALGEKKDSLEKSRLKATKENMTAEIEAQIKANEELTKANKARKDAFDKLVNDTISKAKELSSFLQKEGRLDIGVGFEIDPRKTKIQTFEQAKEFIRKAIERDFPVVNVTAPFLANLRASDVRTADIQGIKFQTIPKTDEQKLQEDLQKHIKPVPIEIKPTVDTKAIDQFNKAVAQAITGGIEDLAAGIGTALGGGGLNNLFSDFGSIVGSTLQAIGKQLVIVGGLAELVQKALKGLFTPQGATLAIASGLALIAAGAALKASLSKGVKGFAEGGLVFGPTVGLVGEGSGTSRSNPEIIAPLDKLKGILGEGFAGGRQRLKVRGQDILLVTSRSNKANNQLG